jgi:hypothetical protein
VDRSGHSNDTQRNFHLTDHHTLGVKTLHGHKDLHTTRQVTLAERNTAALNRNMTMARLAQLRVALYFIRKMCPFSHCEDASYREEAVSDWVACFRDTMCGTIGECLLVVNEQVKFALRFDLKRSVLALVHLNADLWTSKFSHQKFLGVLICWKVGTDLKTALLAVTLYTSPKVEDKQVSEWLLARKHSTNSHKSTGGCGCGIFRTQCTVSSLNDWARN